MKLAQYVRDQADLAIGYVVGTPVKRNGAIPA